ncbi:MAG: YihA family ribosome biogenesis GTP-binding protein [Spirochaetes bacterium]|nr:YihA family ribosome biogenesis GTP-binding protein [Spirochaetota bacterium]
MKIREVHFLTSCPRASLFPDHGLPEFAFLGRSNVGKSSLINMLMNRHDLVKTGAKPGVTRAVNFFILNDSISLADLPGYGYAKVPVEMKKAFLPLIKTYIEKRKNIRLVFLLLDIRRTPDDREREILSLITRRRIPVTLAVTKCDKIPPGRRRAMLRAIAESLGVDDTALFITSALKGTGRRELLGLIRDFAAEERNAP